MAISAKDLGKILGHQKIPAGPGSGAVSTFMRKISSELEDALSPYDKEQFLVSLYTTQGYEKISRAGEWVFLKGNIVNRVPKASKSVKSLGDVLYWRLFTLWQTYQAEHIFRA